MWPWTASTQGYIYIFHFDRPLGNLENRRAQALHYSGFAEDLAARLEKHAAGKGAKLTAAAIAAGITYHVYAWPAPLATEKLLKAQGNTARYCPSCAAAAGRAARPLPKPAPAVQLALDLEELPEITIAPSMGWLEVQISRNWRSARIPQPAGIDDDLL